MENRPAMMDDCNIVTFRKGHKVGVRVTHPESGASGVSVYHNNEHKNRMEAYKKMRKTPEYRQWFLKRNEKQEIVGDAKQETLDLPTTERLETVDVTGIQEGQ